MSAPKSLKELAGEIHYTWDWALEDDHWVAFMYSDGHPVGYRDFPMGTEPDVMAAWAKKEIQILKLKDLVMP